MSCQRNTCNLSACSIREEPHTDVVRSSVILLPFYDEVGTDYPNAERDGIVVVDYNEKGILYPEKIVPYPGRNYTQRRIFCFLKNITPAIQKRYGDDVMVNFGRSYGETKITSTLELWRGNTIVPIVPQEVEFLTKLVDSELRDIPEYHCLVYHLDYPFKINYPRGWVAAILPFLSLSPELDAYVDGCGIYIHLPDNDHYDDVWFGALTDLQHQLSTYYQKGVVVADAMWNREIIASWDLYPYVDDVNIVRDQLHITSLDETIEVRDEDTEECSKNGPCLYAPRWENQWLAPNIVHFLTKLLCGDEFIALDVGYNDVKRHWISTELVRQKYKLDDFYFHRCRLMLRCKSIENAEYWLKRLAWIGRKAHGNVMVSSAELEGVSLPQLESTSKNEVNVKTTEVIYYRVVDDDDYIFKSTWYES